MNKIVKISSLLLSLTLIGCSILDTSFEHEMVRPSFKKFKNEVEKSVYETELENRESKLAIESLIDEETASSYTLIYQHYLVTNQVTSFNNSKAKDESNDSIQYDFVKVIYDKENSTSSVKVDTWVESTLNKEHNVYSNQTSYVYQKDDKQNNIKVDAFNKHYSSSSKNAFDNATDAVEESSRQYTNYTYVLDAKYYIDGDVYTASGIYEGNATKIDHTTQSYFTDNSFLLTTIRESVLEKSSSISVTKTKKKEYVLYSLEVGTGKVKPYSMNEIFNAVVSLGING